MRRHQLWVDVSLACLGVFWTFTAHTLFQAWMAGAFVAVWSLILYEDVKRYRRGRTKRVRLPRSSSEGDA